MRKIIAAMFVWLMAAEATLNYEIYLESWNNTPAGAYISAYQGLPAVGGNPQYQNVTLNLSFLAYNFSLNGLLNGTQFGGAVTGQIPLVQNIITYVHNAGGKVQLAFGGNSSAPPYGSQPSGNQYYLSGSTFWPSGLQACANQIANLVTTLSPQPDGIDFDFEEQVPAGYTHQQFGEALVQFLQYVRTALGASKTITLTIPAQGWGGTYWFYLATGAAAIPGLVNAINFMEYDIWVGAPGGTPELQYLAQVKADIETYTAPVGTAPGPNWSAGWGIPPALVQVGVMPGNDDTGKNMTPANANNLAAYAITKGLDGVFVWDINRDANLSQLPTPFIPSSPAYQFSIGMRNVLNGVSLTVEEVEELYFSPNYSLNGKTSRRFINNPYFYIQPVPGYPPPHGAP